MTITSVWKEYCGNWLFQMCCCRKLLANEAVMCGPTLSNEAAVWDLTLREMTRFLES